VKSEIRLLAAAALSAAFLLFVSPTGIARADMASAVVLANTCFSCHGTEGASIGAMPSIKGKPADFIQAQLTAFRNGKKKGTVMNRIAKGFNNDEIKALSRYFAGKK
jgi:sulfide dehydrogenase cytochrome subunit